MNGETIIIGKNAKITRMIGIKMRQGAYDWQKVNNNPKEQRRNQVFQRQESMRLRFIEVGKSGDWSQLFVFLSAIK